MSSVETGAIKLHKAQAEIFNATNRFKVVAAGRRFGKSILAMTTLVDKAAAKNNQLIWYVAPTYGMAKQIMWNEMIKFIPKKWVRRKNETTLMFELVNGSVIVLKGSDNPDNLRGVGLDYVVLDEVQDMKEDVWKMVLRPTLATTNGGALFIGTSKSYNHFYDLWMNGNNDDTGVWRSWQFMTKDSPFVPRAEIEQAKKDMDENSFRQEYEACHLPETMVSMYGGGAKRISDVEVGELVAHLDDFGEIIPCEIMNVGVTGRKSIMDVVLETGEIISASVEHKFKIKGDL